MFSLNFIIPEIKNILRKGWEDKDRNDRNELILKFFLSFLAIGVFHRVILVIWVIVSDDTGNIRKNNETYE